MPHAAEEHGVEIVEVGGKGLAVAWKDPIDQGKEEDERDGGDGDPLGLCHEGDDGEHD